MSDEIPIMRRCWLAVTATTTLFRVNTGKAWTGAGKPIRNADGSITLPFARPISLGFSLPNGDPVTGAGDLNGWTTIVITPEMVGRRVAIYTSLEIKNSAGGKKSEEQLRWINVVKSAGGCAGFANSPEQAKQIIDNFRSNSL
jgi:hypothetical protein